MKRIILVIAPCIFLVSCGGTATSTGAPAATEQKAEEKSEDTPVSVTSAEYYKKYQENEVAADNLYKGRKILITGQIESINKDVTDDVYVSLSGEGEISFDVQCHLSEPGKAAELKKGQKITILGTGEGMVIGFPQLKDCSIQ
jgi:hypothetical protein